MISIESFPAVEHGRCYAKSFAKSLDRTRLSEVFDKYPQYKEETVGIVRNDGIRKDGVGMTAGTDDSGDPYQNRNRFAAYEVYYVAAVISMDTAITLPPAYGTCFLFRAERFNKRIKNRF